MELQKEGITEFLGYVKELKFSREKTCPQIKKNSNEKNRFLRFPNLIQFYFDVWVISNDILYSLFTVIFD